GRDRRVGAQGDRAEDRRRVLPRDRPVEPEEGLRPDRQARAQQDRGGPVLLVPRVLPVVRLDRARPDRRRVAVARDRAAEAAVTAWHFAHVERVHLLWAVVAVVAILAVLEVKSRDALGQFLSPVMQRRLSARPSAERIAVRIGLVALALAMGVGALMRPQAPGNTETVSTNQAAADIVFVLDVSRSMLAEDAAPNRL